MAGAIIVVILTGYLLGNLNGSVEISMLTKHEDVRTHGSGNAGLTNFFRSYGGWHTLLVLLVDGGKSVMACLVGALLLEPYGWRQEGVMLGAIAVTLGHDFPALLGFHGGKGIVCGFAAALVADWRVALLAAVVFVLFYAVSRYVSLGSVLGAVAFSVGFAIFWHDRPRVGAAGVVLGALALLMHRANLLRLIRGQESKVHLFGKERRK